MSLYLILTNNVTKYDPNTYYIFENGTRTLFANEAVVIAWLMLEYPWVLLALMLPATCTRKRPVARTVSTAVHIASGAARKDQLPHRRMPQLHGLGGRHFQR